MTIEEIIKLLHERRFELKLSQRDLSKRIGIAQSDICGYEKRYQKPNLDNFLKLLEGLDLEMSITPKEDPPVAHLAVPASDLKMLRETFCHLHSQMYVLPLVGRNPAIMSKQLQKLLNEIDRHRPLGSNGKHGNLHTPTCGCEDK